MFYTPDNYNLLETANNAMNFIVLEDILAKRHIAFDWDVDEDKIEELQNKFLCGNLTNKDFFNESWTEGLFKSSNEMWLCRQLG